MNRRGILKFISGLVALWPAGPVSEEDTDHWCSPRLRSPNDQIMVALKKTLGIGGGYVDGDNIRVEHRFAKGRMEHVPGLVRELTQLKVHLFVARAEPLARIQMEMSPSTPIVLVAMGFDLATAGMIDTPGRPGGNITGIYARTGDAIVKGLELLRELRPVIDGRASL